VRVIVGRPGVEGAPPGIGREWQRLFSGPKGSWKQTCHETIGVRCNNPSIRGFFFGTPPHLFYTEKPSPSNVLVVSFFHSPSLLILKMVFAVLERLMRMLHPGQASPNNNPN
jgi:hypothetical protein